MSSSRSLEFRFRQRQTVFALFPTTPRTPAAKRAQGGKNPNEIPSLGDYANRDWPESQRRGGDDLRVDQDGGNALAKLKEHKLDENTIVFFTSDNGRTRKATTIRRFSLPGACAASSGH
jgi:arylsulfatase A-like enzyme